MDYRAYIRQFVSKGIDQKKIYDTLYMTEDQVAEVESDKEFMAELQLMRTELTLRRLDDYDNRVDTSEFPNDHLTRLKNTTALFDKGDVDASISGDLRIEVVKYTEQEKK